MAPRWPILKRYDSHHLARIALPLGGIGTGTVSLGGRGNLRDWEIFNRPNKNTSLPYTFAALRISGGGLPQPVARVLEREPLPPYSASLGLPRGAGLPQGPGKRSHGFIVRRWCARARNSMAHS